MRATDNEPKCRDGEVPNKFPSRVPDKVPNKASEMHKMTKIATKLSAAKSFFSGKLLVPISTKRCKLDFYVSS